MFWLPSVHAATEVQHEWAPFRMLRSTVDGFKGLLCLLNQTFICSGSSLESLYSTKVTAAYVKAEFGSVF